MALLGALLIHAGAALALRSLPWSSVSPHTPVSLQVILLPRVKITPANQPTGIIAEARADPSLSSPPPLESPPPVKAPTTPNPAPAAKPPAPAVVPAKQPSRRPIPPRQTVPSTTPVQHREKLAVMPSSQARETSVSSTASQEKFIEARYQAGGLNNPKPPYPYAARRQGLEGRVMLTVTITPDGSAASVEIAASSGHPLLDQAASRTVQNWRFIPAQRNGQAVTARIQVPITFKLE